MELVLAVYLAVVILGLLVMTRLVKLEELGKGISHAFLVLILFLGVFWVLEVMMLPILVCGLVWLKQAMLTIAVVLLITVGIGVLLRIAVVKFVKLGSDRTSHEEKLR